jgi:cell division protease FtsH
MSAEPDYSDEVAKEIDDEIRRVIEEAHDTASRVLQDHMEVLHRLSAILIERETIDKDQFERLLAGEPEESVFAEETKPAEAPKEEPESERKPALKPQPRPLPGAAMQPPPDPAAG